MFSRKDCLRQFREKNTGNTDWTDQHGFLYMDYDQKALCVNNESRFERDKVFAVEKGIEIVIKPTAQQKLVQTVGKMLSYC